MISILVAWRTDRASRERAWDYLKALYDRPGYELVVGDDGTKGPEDGPFCTAAAFNDAFRRSTGDTVVIYGADHVPDFDAFEKAAARLDERMWTPTFATVTHYTAESTADLIAGTGPGVAGFREGCCTGALVLRRDAYEEIGGFDERFKGWGCEDTAFRRILMNLYGDYPPVAQTLYCLHHDAPDRGVISQETMRVICEYERLGEDKPTTLAYLRKRGSFI